MTRQSGPVTERVESLPSRLCIAVADASRARLFSFEQVEAPPGVRSQDLRERVSLVDPARRRRPSELFSDTRPGSDRAPGSGRHAGRTFAFDDHREAAQRKMDRDFAADIADAIDRVTREHGCTRMILAASPRMLGMLREQMGPLAAGVELHEIDRNLVHLSNAELHDDLAARGLMPERERLPAPSDMRLRP